VANLHILREHSLGLTEARKIAFQWAEQVETEFQMACTYEEGDTLDEVGFTRSGVSGKLEVTKDKFELNATLGFLLGAFKGRIEAEIVKNLDSLLANRPTDGEPKKTAVKKPATKK
jgi:putative polyhydroxyalkanoate system protein